MADRFRANSRPLTRRAAALADDIDNDFLGKLEAPPGFEPGMEVLQGHPRSLPHDRSPGRSRWNSHLLNRMHRSPLPAHHVQRWLKLGSVCSWRAQFGHSS